MKFLTKPVLAITITFQSVFGVAAETATMEDIAQLQSQLDALSTQVITLMNENSQLTSTLNKQATTIDDQELSIINLQNEKGLLSTEIENLQLDIGEVQNDISLLPSAPVGTILAWHKDLTGVPAELGDEWVICNGQIILDPESPLYGQNSPDLNSDKYEAGKGLYLRGGATSGVVNESTQITDNGYKYGFSNRGSYYGAAYFSIYDAEDFVGQPNGFYSSNYRVKARFQVAAMTVVWIMKIK
ncbi:hypothetical protein C2869_05955 [Saccharobesus litoralis]|uniref:Uncharacterized protein n=1 Tax=Saccharobesus litoralis TaxID=2172099 RepID=A0A2S0VP82_9ALTE|nr:hypothetical protein [Saccharobesus litoralis]AWB66009.1 hypothetical protein C2869_05955 [Saccharobesus litoralis]